MFNQYCSEGGFPEYVKYQQVDYLRFLYGSIIYRDIIARYKISNPKFIKELLFFLRVIAVKKQPIIPYKNY